MATLIAMNVGMPKDVAWHGKTIRTGVWKQPVAGPLMARSLNLDGDGQGDLARHGGEQRAVLVYPEPLRSRGTSPRSLMPHAVWSGAIGFDLVSSLN
ncbi:hypothetical protein ACWFRM_41365 [Streptomyces sp. NPDC055144]